jgi:multifunctional methyltransferase subunit TRM112
MLQCHVKDCIKDNYPLKIKDAQLDVVEADFNPEFIRKIISRLDWNALIVTAKELGITGLPETIDDQLSEEMCKVIHHVILEHKINDGKMICNGCGHIYEIHQGIPNMLLQNSEV